MTRAYFALMFAASLPFSVPAQAILCSGKATSVGLTASGWVEVDFGFGNTQICSVKEDRTFETGPYGAQLITVDFCKTLLAQFMYAKATNTQVFAHISGPSCPAGNTLPTPWPYHWRFE